ncbi:MAG: ATP-binding protein, partial [Kiritimatiellae bacterium]|nr:ATP-binding protein [Kiritimatiellia bacterium]
ANNVLKQAIGTIAESYPYIVIDNEAGLENLSRRIVHKVDLMIMVADPSMRGVETLERLYELTNEMGIEYNKLALIINRMRKDELPDAVKKLQKSTNADYLIGLPDNEEIADFAEIGKNLLMLSKGNVVAEEIDALLEKALEKN